MKTNSISNKIKSTKQLTKRPISVKNEILIKNHNHNPELQSSKIDDNIKVTLGGSILNNQALLSELNNKIQELNNFILQTENDRIQLKALNSELILKQENHEFELNELKIKIEHLEVEFANCKNEEMINKIKINEITINESDNIKTIKTLTNEIEELGNKICKYEQSLSKLQREVAESDRIKFNYEQKIIDLTKKNLDNETKLAKLDNILKQKEKYIDILLKKTSKANGSNCNLREKIVEDIKDQDTKNIIQEKLKMEEKQILSSNSNTILQNKIYELEITLNKQLEVIKKLELEKQNLLTRMRNSSKR